MRPAIALLVVQLVSTDSLRIPLRLTAARSSTSRSQATMSEDSPNRSPSFWDVVLHGSRAKGVDSKLSKGDLVKIQDLKKVFHQWDTNGDGVLELVELQRGFLAAGIEASEWSSVFSSLDANGDKRITYEEFEANLSDEQRKAIESKLNEKGVMNSLYVPPEKWEDTKTAEESRWEQKVKFQAQLHGNQVRQNEILNKHLGS